MKKLLSREETLYPNIYDHIRRALIPVMHDDSTAIMRSYLEETIAKSRKVPHNGKSKKANTGATTKSTNAPPTCNTPETMDQKNAPTLLENATEDELIAELARRKANKFQLAGAMKRLPCHNNADDKFPEDATGQMCSLTGGDGMIPCRELME